MGASTAAIAARVSRISRELKIFAVASLALGVAYSVMDFTFNNFLTKASR